MKQCSKSEVIFDFWACQRPLTHRWGSGQVFKRLVDNFGPVDVAFGKTDQIPDDVFYVDKSNGYNWLKLPFADNQFFSGFWDPPYDRLYKNEGVEIWRTVKKLAILHVYIFPHAWLANSKRIAMVAVTMGPLKRIRCLQIFEKQL